MAAFLRAQHYAIDLTGATSNTATISAVTLAQCFVTRPTWQNPGSSDNRDDWIRHALTSTTVATMSRAGTTGNVIAYGSTIEIDSAYVVSRQSGTITIGISATSNTATISAVTKNNSIIIFHGCEATAGGSTSHQYYDARVVLTNGTTVTATVASALSTTIRTIGYTVIELASGALAQAVQHLSLSTTGTSSNHAVTTVVTADTVVFANGHTGTDENGNKVKLSLNSTTNIIADKAVSATTAAEACVWHLPAGLIVAQHNLSNAHAQADQTKDGTITTVDRTRAFVNPGGYWTNGDEPDEARIGGAFTSDTNVRTYRGGASTSASTDTSNFGYQVIEGANLTTDTGVGSAAGVATAAGVMTADANMAGSSTGTGAAAGVFNADATMAGSSAAAATSNATLTADANQVGSSSGTSTGAATAIADADMSGSSAGQGAASAGMAGDADMGGSSGGSGAGSGGFAADADMVGTSAGTSSADAVGDYSGMPPGTGIIPMLRRRTRR